MVLLDEQPFLSEEWIELRWRGFALFFCVFTAIAWSRYKYHLYWMFSFVVVRDKLPIHFVFLFSRETPTLLEGGLAHPTSDLSSR